jgi:hypothetical protein
VFGVFVFVVVFLAAFWLPVSGRGFFVMPVFGVFLLGQIVLIRILPGCVLGVFVWRV